MIKPEGKKGTLWLDTYVDGKRVRKSLGTTDPHQAQREADRLLRKFAGEEGWTLRTAYERTLSTRWKGTRSEATMTINAESAIRFFGAECPLTDIKTDTLDGYVEYLERLGNADGTINRKLTCVSTMLRTAVDREALERLPKFPRKREHRGRIRYFTEQEEEALVNLMHQWDQSRLADLFVFLVDTGLRLGEALRLEWRDITPQGVTVWESKGNTQRTIPLTGRAREALRSRHRTGQGRVFTVTRHQVRHYFDRAKAVMGLADDKQFVVHALRHTCASRLVQRGIPLKVIQEFLGHTDIQTTMRYAHLAPSSLEAATEALEVRSPPTLRRVK